MTPLLQFRLWWRRGDTGSKVGATLAVGLVLALLVWILTPAGESETAGSTNLQTGPGGTALNNGTVGPGGTIPAGAVAGGATGATVPGGGPAPGGGTAGSAGGGDDQSAAADPTAPLSSTGTPCQPTPGGAPGVTDDTITVAVALLDLAGPIGNEAANQAPAEDSQRLVDALIADINARGGAGCRELVPNYFNVNPIGADQGRAACLAIVQSGPAVVVDLGGFAFPQSAYMCVAQQQVPLLTAATILTSEPAQFPGYLASVAPDLGTVIRDTAFGLRDTGYFDPANGFAKLGILADECATEVNDDLDAALATVGIRDDQISRYTFACPPNGFASPNDMAQAATQHQLAGVTHVIPLTGGGSFRLYTEAAEGQGFRPRYAITDYQGNTVTAESSLRPNPNNFDRAVAMSPTTRGILTTPGFAIDPGTVRCQSIAEAAGLPADMVPRGGGGACSAIWAIEAALNHAPALSPDSILPGLFNAGPIQQAYPLPDVTYSAPSKYYGGDTWAPIEWHRECTCWFVLEPARRPSYPA